MKKTAYSKSQAENYDVSRFTNSKGLVFNKMEMDQLNKILRSLSKNSKVLEVGCGTGRFLKNVALQDFRVTGVDPSKYMLKETVKKTKTMSNVSLYNCEGEKLPFKNNTFDFVYSIRVLNQVSSEDYALNMICEMLRVCKDDGIVLVEYVNKKSLSFFTTGGTKLNKTQIDCSLKNHSVKLLDFTGILLLSQSILELTPKSLLPLYKRIDSALSNFFPSFCTRCYLTMKKTTSRNVGFYIPRSNFDKDKKEIVGGEIKIGLKTCELIKQSGYDLTLITSIENNKINPKINNFDLRLLPKISNMLPFNFFVFSIHLIKILFIIKKSNLRIMHFFGGQYTAYLAGFTKILNRNCRVVVSLTNFNNKKNPIGFFLLNRLDLFFSLTNYTKINLINFGINERKILVSRPGIENKWLVKRKKIDVGFDNFVLFWRDAEWQNGAFICGESFKLLAKDFPHVGFVFAIRPNHHYESFFYKLSKENPNIRLYIWPYAGFDISDLVYSSSVIVLPFKKLSIHPQISLIESLCSGRPIITTPIESNKEIIENMENVFTISPNVKCLTSCLRKIIENFEINKTIEGGPRLGVIENWNWDNYKNNILDIYNWIS